MSRTKAAAIREERSRALLDAEIRACTRCPGMNIENFTQAAPGFGSLRSPVVIVGQSLCGPCMKRQEPFVGGSGTLLMLGWGEPASPRISYS